MEPKNNDSEHKDMLLSQVKYICKISKKQDNIESINECVKILNKSYKNNTEFIEYYAKNGQLTTKQIYSTDGDNKILIFDRKFVNKPKVGDTKVRITEMEYSKNIKEDLKYHNDEAKHNLLSFNNYICDIVVSKDSDIESITNCNKTSEGNYNNSVWEEVRFLNNKRIIVKQIDENNEWIGDRIKFFANDGTKMPCGTIYGDIEDKINLGENITEDATITNSIQISDEYSGDSYCKPDSSNRNKSFITCDFIFKKNRGLESVTNCKS